MCEFGIECKCKAKYWVQRSSMSNLVCGRHLPQIISTYHSVNPATAHESYHLHVQSPIIVRMRFGHGWR
jgi:hypothetical protein